MRVHIPSPLQSYTGGKSQVNLSGATVREVLESLDRRYPGARFRIISEQDTVREHIRIFVNVDLVSNLGTPVGADDELHIISALSGG